MERVEHIVFIGYSLPETDEHATKLFEACREEGRRVTVVNPSAYDEGLHARYRSMLGREDLRFVRSNFEEFATGL